MDRQTDRQRRVVRKKRKRQRERERKEEREREGLIEKERERDNSCFPSHICILQFISFS